MTSQKPRDKTTHNPAKTVPFLNAEEAWFWFIAAQNAKNDQAKYTAGAGLYPRPCEPVDILKVLDRLHRNRRLVKDHLLVLRHYGMRHMPPDPTRRKEARAFQLWTEALERIAIPLEKKGIIEPRREQHENWYKEAFVYENHYMTEQHGYGEELS